MISPASRSKSARQGFSLIEMLVVVAIVLILLMLISPVLHGAMERARMVQCAANLRSIQAAAMAFADSNEDVMVPSQIRPWAFSSEHLARMQEHKLGRWWHRWPSVLMKDGRLDMVPMGSPTVGYPLGSGEDAIPARGGSVFVCPSARYAYGAGEVPGPSPWDPVGNLADKTLFAAGSAPHGPTQSTTITYAHFPVHYGANGSNESTDFAMVWNPAGSLFRFMRTTSYTNPSALITFYDGRFRHIPNHQSTGFVSARHMRRTMTNLAFADGHVIAFRTQDLPSYGKGAPDQYPSWRR